MRWGFALAVLATSVAGCLADEEPGGGAATPGGPTGEPGTEDGPLVWPWEPLPCDANAGNGLSTGAALGGPFSASLGGMGDALERMIQVDVFVTKAPGPRQTAEWSFHDGSRGGAWISFQGSAPLMMVSWREPWPSENESQAKEGFAAALERFDGSLEWTVEGGTTYHSPGAEWISLLGRGVSADGRRSVEATHRIEDGLSSLVLWPALQAPDEVDPQEERHRGAVEAYVRCLQETGDASGRVVDRTPMSPAPAHGAWTVPFGVRPEDPSSVPSGHCTYAPMTVYVDAVTGAIVLDSRGVCI